MLKQNEAHEGYEISQEASTLLRCEIAKLALKEEKKTSQTQTKKFFLEEKNKGLFKKF